MTSLRGLSLGTAFSLLATMVAAEVDPWDAIHVPVHLSDAEFYRLATCGALPDGPCRASALRWDKPKLTIRIDMAGETVPDGFDRRLAQALDHAIGQINGVKAGIRLTVSTRPDADITIRPTALIEGTVLTEVPGVSGPGIMGVGYMTVWSDENDHIDEAVILISTSITDADLTSVMLEEVTQSLGFLFDIDGPAYEGVSILSQTSNATLTLEGQDAALLRLHYPPME